MIKKVVLDDYEQGIEDSLDSGEWVDVLDKEISREDLMKAAARTIERKSKMISLRLFQSDIANIKKRAAKKGLPYQTLISSILHQYATGELEVKL